MDNYPFRMYGRTVQVLRYQVDYTEVGLDEEGREVQREATALCRTQEEAQAQAALHEGATVTQLDTSAVDWMDGLEVKDVPDTYGEAVKIAEAGPNRAEALVRTDIELAEQAITELELTAIEQGQQITELELFMLGGNENV